MIVTLTAGWGWIRRGESKIGLRPIAAASALLAIALTVLLHYVGPPAIDAPAHLFQTLTFARDGYALWNNYWYSGHYEFVDYSLGYYPLATVAGILVLAIAAAAVTATMFASLATSIWGPAARLPSLCFATTASVVAAVSGMYPFAAGLAIGLVVLKSLQTGRRWWAALGIVLTAALSPLALLFLLVVLAAVVVAAADRRRLIRQNRVPVAAVAGTLAGAGAIDLVFAESSYYPYHLPDLATVAFVSLVGLWLTRFRVRRNLLGSLFCIYLAINLVVFAVPSPIGANATRMYSIAATALIWLACRSRRPALSAKVTALILASTLAVQLAPYAHSAYSSFEARASAAPAFWRPALNFLSHHHDRSRRVEVVATADHWEAYYMAKAGISLARGWYRQLDFPQNALLYKPQIDPRAYRRWLRRLGVTYVLLPKTTLDYSSTAEAALLDSGRSGLRLVQQTPNWRIYKLPAAVGLVTGAHTSPTNVSLGANSVGFDAPHAGRYLIRVHYSPYWNTAPGVCLTPSSDGMILANVKRAGTVSLTMPDAIDAVLNSGLSADNPGCPG